MNCITRIIGAICFVSASTAFSASATADADQADMQSWYDDLRPHSLIEDPEKQCVPVARLEDARSEPLREKAEHLFSVLERTEISARVAQAFKAEDGALCFGPTNWEAGALYFNEYDLVYLDEDDSEGCLVSAAVQEFHHATQKHHGVGAPRRDLIQDEQERLILASERDGHTIHVLAVWMLANPQYAAEPYAPAWECLRGEQAALSPYLTKAANELEEIAEQRPEWIADGQAARQIYEIFAIDKELWSRYTFPLKFYYDCDYVSDCLKEVYTLGELGIDFGAFGTIHYERDYRQLPYNTDLGPRPVAGEVIPRNEILP